MSNQRIHAIEYIRGISMLGVIGIHTGAYSLSNPHVNVHLFALLEIFTRFSVPIFFFVSAFGLFYNHDVNAAFSYWPFLKRRLRTVLIPYITWSLLYMLHYTITSGDQSIWHRPLVYKFLAFGLASYQLYFLVILLWFYLLMPLWRILVRLIMSNPIRDLGILLILQIAFNYYSCFILRPEFQNHYLNILVQFRLSYWVVHYIFIFILGAICAVYYPQFINAAKRNQRSITVFFALALTGMLTFYYYLLYSKGYNPEAAVNVAQQLSPIGVVYTLAATLYFFTLFSFTKMPAKVTWLFSALGKHSYLVYLIHPLMMYYLTRFINDHNYLMTAKITITFFLATALLSLGFASFVQLIGRWIPYVPLLLAGSSATKRKQPTN